MPVLRRFIAAVRGDRLTRPWVILVLASTAAGCSAASAPARRYINLPVRSLQAPFSDAVLVGNTLYLAGQIGLDAQTGRPPDDPAEEARLVLGQIRAVLAEAGFTMADLVSVQVFCSDVSLFNTWNEIYRTMVPQPFPARAFVGAGPLLFDARFEIQGIAVRRQ